MKTPCKHPGCSALLDKSGWCETHQAAIGQADRDYDIKRQRDPVLAYNRKVRTGKRWLKVRLLKLSANPTCEDPHGDHARRGTTESAKQIHHIQGLSTHSELAYHWDNLMSVCTACHAKLEAQAKHTGGME